MIYVPPDVVVSTYVATQESQRPALVAMDTIRDTVTPENSGGYFLSGDQLIIVTLDDSTAVDEQVATTAMESKADTNLKGYEKNAKFKKGSFTQQQLLDIYNYVSDHYMGETGYLWGCAVKIDTNQVELDFKEDIFKNSGQIQKAIEDIRNAVKTDLGIKLKNKDIAAVFTAQQGKVMQACTTAVAPGSSMLWATGTDSILGTPSTLGATANIFYASDINKLITCGHLFLNPGATVKDTGGSMVGTITKISCGGALDCAFIDVAPGVTVNTILPDGKTISGVGYTVAGQILTRYGNTTGITTDNTLQAYPASYTMTAGAHGNISMTQAFFTQSATIGARSGDSGGILAYPNKTVPTQTLACGITSAIDNAYGTYSAYLVNAFNFYHGF